MRLIKEFNQFKIYEMSDEEFLPKWKPLVKEIFEDQSLTYKIRDLISDSEKEKLKTLKEALKNRVSINLGVFNRDEFVAWSAGYQENHGIFYVMSSAVREEHRRQGVYSELVQLMIARAKDHGFLKLMSQHVASNNPVIIAKLKLGFKITGIEINDQIGLVLQLTYFIHDKRNEILDFRTGLIRPSENIKDLFKI